MYKRLVLITGANGQIGSYLAKEYASSQENLLILLYHQRHDRLEQFSSIANVTLSQCDLMNYEETQKVVHDCISQYPKAQICVIHAASVRSSDAKNLADTDPAVWMSTFERNIIPAYNLLRAILPVMCQRTFGRIVLFGSSVTKTGLKSGSAYAAAKAAIANLGRSACSEYADRSILINTISPAPVDTDLSQDYAGEYLAFRKAYFSQYLDRVPTKKLVSIKEIYILCNLLLDEQITNVCGQEFYIDGGIS